MNPPGPIKGDRQIPDSAISRRQIGEILYQHLADIRRREGVDPARYPAVDYDLQYDTRRTLYGAEVVARETADLILPPLLADRKPNRSHWLLRLLRHPLVSAGAIAIAGFAGLRELDAIAARQHQIVQTTQSDILHAMQSSQAKATTLAEAQRCEINELRDQLTANAGNRSFYEAIGHLFNNSPQIIATIGPETATFKVLENLTRKEQGRRIIEIKHGLTPVELDNLRQTVEAAKAVSIQK